jgi:hypothetical protein
MKNWDLIYSLNSGVKVLTADKALKHVDPYIPSKAKLQVIGLEDAKNVS